MNSTPRDPLLPYQPNMDGYREAEGHASSLLQQAIWIEDSLDGTGDPNMRVDLGDVDTDEMRSAAQFIMKQNARIEELEDLGRFLVARLEEFDPGDDEPEREYHGHVAPALARFSAALPKQEPGK